ncbi:hypothetical protein [Paenibacillus gorillae]|uniref:hypothetical protein n=1 Tax=Paenibacillus gorillae TaxID=1243662 RepID=UPI0004B42426|nr:hypothetical protein [Paenibacillus gorillae]
MERQNRTRWTIGKDEIVWEVAESGRLPHEDHLEMSGKQVSMIVRYGVDGEGKLVLSRTVVWPGLRTIPNNTHGSLMQDFGQEVMPFLQINGKQSVNERPLRFQFDGLLRMESEAEDGLLIVRTLFPSTDVKAALEKVTLTNTSSQPVKVQVIDREERASVKGAYGIYLIAAAHDADGGEQIIEPGQTLQFGIRITAKTVKETDNGIDISEEEGKRQQLVARSRNHLRLETPDAVLDRMFAFAKLRTAESIFETRNGLMHSPGGGHYYAAVWTNDQVEYAGPLFPYLGYAPGNEATLNALRLYTNFMGPNFEPIPSSIIAEGIDIWEGAGDRGDAAMYAYGASLFALSSGDLAIAEELWPAIEWCLEFCERQKTADGVIASDSDELENRFPSGSANLSTSCLAYAAYEHAADLAVTLGKTEAQAAYKAAAEELYAAIENYFGATVEGFETYRYYDGNDVLRSWICIPLTMGIETRKTGTIQALLSPRLWTEDGLATEAGDTTFWDRSTLYGLRGMYAAGETETATAYLASYSGRRLLGDHVPYPVEAYPEGNQRHLSAESALYCRIVTEGLFGIRPTGLSAFSCIPRLPEGWSTMALRSVQAFGRQFDLVVNALPSGIELIVSDENGSQRYSGANGEAFEVKW